MDETPRPTWNVRLELRLAAVDPDVFLAFIRPLTPIRAEDAESLTNLFYAAAGGVWIRESFPDVLSFDLNDHVRYHLPYLESVGWPAKQAIMAEALRLVVDGAVADWLDTLESAVAAELRNWGISLVVDSREPDDREVR